MAKTAQKYLEVDPWLVVEKGFHRGRSLVSESVFSLGNEFMGVRGYFEEGYSGETTPGSFFNGIFEDEDTVHPAPHIGMATRCHFLANSVDWLYARLSVGGERLDLAKSKFSQFTRTLDMREGTLTRSFVWTVRENRKLKVTFQRFTSMATPNLGGQRVCLESLNFSGTVHLTMGIDFNPVQHTRNNRLLWPTVRTRASGKILAVVGQTERTRHRVFSSMQVRAPRDAGIKRISKPRTAGYDVMLRLKKGEPVTTDKIVVNTVTKNTRLSLPAFWKRGLALARRHRTVTYDAALKNHADFWHRQWKKLDVQIEGNPMDQQGVRFAIFNLNQIYHGVDPDLNVSAKGLTGEDYEGHTWWDTETYCLPFYLFNNADAARNLLGYRYSRLPQARERAMQKGCEGACYPMDTIDGTESSRSWQNGDMEIHVPAAVSFGIWHYVHLTGDKNFLYTQGIEMLLEISRYFADRGAWSQTSGKFGFWCVVGPDEFHFAVHNNVYTNVMAKKTFEFTLQVVSEMRRKAPAKLARASKAVKLRKDEPGNWRRMAGNMIILQDPKTGILEQFENYFGMPHIDCDSISQDDFPLVKHWAYYKIFRWDMIKQPDALLLLFLHSRDYTLKEKRANFDYYEHRCIHESSLSPGIHSIVAAEVGRDDKAAKYWGHAARLDLDDYNRNTKMGLHTTSMAATWMNVVYGFGGMRSDHRTLIFNPTIPKVWKAFSFRVLYRGSVLEVKIDRKQARFRTVEGRSIPVRVFDRPCRIGATELVVPLKKGRRKQPWQSR